MEKGRRGDEDQFSLSPCLLVSLLGFIGAWATVIGLTQRRDDARRPPNFVIIFADDLGYSDIDIWPLLANRRNAQSPHDALYFYWGKELHAVRSGNWKLHLPHPYQHLEQVGGDGRPGRYVRQEQELALFDLEKDLGETTNVAGRNPDVVKKLMTFVERARADLGDALVGREGKNVREPGRLASSGN